MGEIIWKNKKFFEENPEALEILKTIGKMYDGGDAVNDMKWIPQVSDIEYTAMALYKAGYRKPKTDKDEDKEKYQIIDDFFSIGKLVIPDGPYLTDKEHGIVKRLGLTYDDLTMHRLIKLYEMGYRKQVWHKVADGDLPKDKQEVRWYVINYNLERFYHNGCYDNIAQKFISDEDYIYEKDDVIAWTELPKYEVEK